MSPRRSASVVAVLWALSPLSALAQPMTGGAGDLLVAPTRVVLEGTTRSASLLLRNAGSQPALYRLSFEELEMDEQGAVHAVSERSVEDGAAAPLVRFSPRQVLLQPGATQVVRLSLRKPAGLPEGEYRSHLTVRAVPQEEPQEQRPVAGRGWSVSLTPVFGVSVPVIVRHGATEATVRIAQARWLPAAGSQPDRVEILLERDGSRSVCGDLQIVAGSKKRMETIGRARGVAVWTPNHLRTVVVPLSQPAAGPLNVVYAADGEELASASVTR